MGPPVGKNADGDRDRVDEEQKDGARHDDDEAAANGADGATALAPLVTAPADGNASPDANAAMPAAEESVEAEAARKEKEVEDWVEANQFGVLWEALTFVTEAVSGIPSMQRQRHPAPPNYERDFSSYPVFVAHAQVLFAGLCVLTWIRCGCSPALLLNRWILAGNITARSLLWLAVLALSVLASHYLNWHRLALRHCENSNSSSSSSPPIVYPLLCLPLVAGPAAAIGFVGWYGPTSLVLLPLRALYAAASELKQGARGSVVVLNLAVRFGLYCAAELGLYVCCLRAITESGSSSSSSADVHQMLQVLQALGRALRFIFRGISWTAVAVLFGWLALESSARAVGVAGALVQRQRNGGRWRVVLLLDRHWEHNHNIPPRHAHVE